jgi:hypothetical protein
VCIELNKKQALYNGVIQQKLSSSSSLWSWFSQYHVWTNIIKLIITSYHSLINTA